MAPNKNKWNKIQDTKFKNICVKMIKDSRTRVQTRHRSKHLNEPSIDKIWSPRKQTVNYNKWDNLGYKHRFG